MSEYSEFFLNRSGSVVQLECIEFAHPAFASTFYVVRNSMDGVTVQHEDGTSHFYEYYPLQIDRGTTNDDLDQTLSITLGDMGAVLPVQIDAVNSSNFADIKPTIKFRIYRHDDLTKPIYSLQTLEVSSLSRDGTGAATFVAKAVELNNTKTGQIYSLNEYPSLRGFL